MNSSGPAYIQDMDEQYSPLHFATAISLLLSYQNGGPATASQNHYCYLSWLHKSEMTLPLDIIVQLQGLKQFNILDEVLYKSCNFWVEAKLLNALL